jgi:hypothetical protein
MQSAVRAIFFKWIIADLQEVTTGYKWINLEIVGGWPGNGD